MTKLVEHATDAQLRALARRFQAPLTLVESELPLLTAERTQLVNLLKHNNVFQFIQ